MLSLCLGGLTVNLVDGVTSEVEGPETANTVD
jgi:hypothetical protein